MPSANSLLPSPHADQNHFHFNYDVFYPQAQPLSKRAWDITGHILFNKTEFTKKHFSEQYVTLDYSSDIP